MIRASSHNTHAQEKAARDHDAKLLADLKKKLEAEKAWGVEAQGTLGTFEYRLYLTQQKKRLSAWHDVPLLASPGVYHAVIEMPKKYVLRVRCGVVWCGVVSCVGAACVFVGRKRTISFRAHRLLRARSTDAKMEVSTSEPLNPIKQDVKNGVLRVIKHGKSRYNYGMLPQTWENPKIKLAGTEFGGDDDPLDIVELGSAPVTRGSVIQVKVVGALGLIDEGELDWKLLAINVDDPKAAKINGTSTQT